MPEHRLFSETGDRPPIEVFLGEYACDVPFGGGETERVAASLTTDSPRSKHGIPVLRLAGGHRMDFTAREQTPAGHAALLVARWLGAARPEGAARRAAELFLWQWPGIEPGEDGRWRLADEEARQARCAPPFVDVTGRVIAVDDVAREAMLASANLQTGAQGFCRKDGPCYLLDGCLLCPHFLTTAACWPAIEVRIPGLRDRLEQALAANNQRLAETCQQALAAIETIRRALERARDNEGGTT